MDGRLLSADSKDDESARRNYFDCVVDVESLVCKLLCLGDEELAAILSLVRVCARASTCRRAIEHHERERFFAALNADALAIAPPREQHIEQGTQQSAGDDFERGA